MSEPVPAAQLLEALQASVQALGSAVTMLNKANDLPQEPPIQLRIRNLLKLAKLPQSLRFADPQVLKEPLLWIVVITTHKPQLTASNIVEGGLPSPFLQYFRQAAARVYRKLPGVDPQLNDLQDHLQDLALRVISGSIAGIDVDTLLDMCAGPVAQARAIITALDTSLLGGILGSNAAQSYKKHSELDPSMFAGANQDALQVAFRVRDRETPRELGSKSPRILSAATPRKFPRKEASQQVCKYCSFVKPPHMTWAKHNAICTKKA